MGKEKLKICSDCKQEQATITYGKSMLDVTHGFTKEICQRCYNKIRDNNTWYKEGIQTGKQQAKKEFLTKSPRSP